VPGYNATNGKFVVAVVELFIELKGLSDTSFELRLCGCWDEFADEADFMR
jgi:hypothetical protein